MSPEELQGRIPIYRQVADHYAEKIRTGEIKAGERLPSLLQLCEIWRISNGTAVKVIATLRQDGLIESSSRRGTFAAPQLLLPVNQPGKS